MENPNVKFPSRAPDSFHERFASIDLSILPELNFKERLSVEENPYERIKKLENQIRILNNENKSLQKSKNKYYNLHIARM